jgi:hypothetical protein
MKFRIFFVLVMRLCSYIGHKELTAKELSSELARIYVATGCICKLPSMNDVKVDVSNHYG